MNRKGFTLIELLAVILILGIIMLIAIPTVTKVIETARIGAMEATGNQIVTAGEKYIKICEMNNRPCSKNIKAYLNANDISLKSY